MWGHKNDELNFKQQNCYNTPKIARTTFASLFSDWSVSDYKNQKQTSLKKIFPFNSFDCVCLYKLDSWWNPIVGVPRLRG